MSYEATAVRRTARLGSNPPCHRQTDQDEQRFRCHSTARSSGPRLQSGWDLACLAKKPMLRPFVTCSSLGSPARHRRMWSPPKHIGAWHSSGCRVLCRSQEVENPKGLYDSLCTRRGAANFHYNVFLDRTDVRNVLVLHASHSRAALFQDQGLPAWRSTTLSQPRAQGTELLGRCPACQRNIKYQNRVVSAETMGESAFRGEILFDQVTVKQV